MTQAATVQHPDPHFIETLSGQPTSGHTYVIDPRSVAAVAALPAPYTNWRRVRVTYEWAGLSLLLIAGSHWLGGAINLGKHDGTGTYQHQTLNPGGIGAIAGRTIGTLEIVGQRQDGQAVDGGWWQFLLTGYYTTDNAPNPNNMGGDYWSILGRLACGSGDFKLASYSGEAGRVSMHVTYDWPST